MGSVGHKMQFYRTSQPTAPPSLQTDSCYRGPSAPLHPPFLNSFAPRIFLPLFCCHRSPPLQDHRQCQRSRALITCQRSLQLGLYPDPSVRQGPVLFHPQRGSHPIWNVCLPVLTRLRRCLLSRLFPIIPHLFDKGFDSPVNNAAASSLPPELSSTLGTGLRALHPST